MLDLGAGSGIVGIAAAVAGARQVLAAEIDGHAVAALRLNAALNGVSIEVLPGDPLGQPPPEVDLVAVVTCSTRPGWRRGSVPFSAFAGRAGRTCWSATRAGRRSRAVASSC
ncbi:50S ribosomal protein L11 methyltransferase [Sphingosinicella sp. LHD-64]|uniref:50S ribosomal protein L11 methyltransferase n=1 Tax=Sphingosinicella sp. LHD-64 TaxID=3072139 RepID=UPI0028103CBF|nr:50S ribosomal protein L11 methyltransferase [Sphingosinicella sp. LHD-64]MDQ8757756.1 50S ribosomal protein L11 methyltransferase [Sphingosinicella sp. LHD-64]